LTREALSRLAITPSTPIAAFVKTTRARRSLKFCEMQVHSVA
jgi:hypothetical protein